MKRMIIAEKTEFEDLIPAFRMRINVVYEPVVEVAASSKIPPLQDSEGNYISQAVTLYEDFVFEALQIFDEKGLEILEEHDSPYSKSTYYTFIRREDATVPPDYKYLLFVRLSDHDPKKETQKHKMSYYNNKAELLKQPATKRRQRWKLKEITVNGTKFASYDEALRDIEKRLSNL